MATETVKTKQPAPYVYTDINAVPAVWRTLRGGTLNLAQINQIMTRAYALGYWREHTSGEPYYVPNLAKARDELTASHELTAGLWTPQAKG